MAGGGQQQQPTQRTTVELSPEQQALFRTAYPGIATFAAQTPQRYQGPTVAGFTPTQMEAQQAAIGGAGAQADIARRAADVWGGIPAGLTPFAGRDIATSSDITVSPDVWARATPTLGAAIEAAQRPTWEALTEQALPAIRSTAIAGGPFGGSRQQLAEGVATGRATRAAGDIAARMTQDELARLEALTQQRYATNIGAEQARYATNVGAEGQRYGQNLAAMYQALGMAPTVAGLQTGQAATLGAVGDVQQAMEQARINEAIQNFNFAQYAPYLQSRDIMSLISGMPGASTVSTANVPQANKAMQALGGAATGASMGAMFGPVGMGVGAAGGAMLPFLFA